MGADMPTPGSGWPSWDAMRQQAYRWLQLQFARGGQAADWNDLAQDAVLKVIVALQTGKVDAAKFNWSWFRSVVEHVARDWWRRDHPRDRKREFVEWQEDHTDADERPADELRQVDARQDVQGFLARTPSLSPEQRVVLNLTYWYNQSLRQIADVLGVSHNQIYQWLQDALKQLRESAGEG